MSIERDMIDGAEGGGWNLALLPRGLRNYISPYTAQYRAKYLAELLAALQAAAPQPPNAQTVGGLREGDWEWLRSMRGTGHCGEGTLELQMRRRHNDFIDRILAALSPPLATPAQAEACMADEYESTSLRTPPDNNPADDGASKGTDPVTGESTVGSAPTLTREEGARRLYEAMRDPAAPPPPGVGYWVSWDDIKGLPNASDRYRRGFDAIAGVEVDHPRLVERLSARVARLLRELDRANVLHEAASTRADSTENRLAEARKSLERIDRGIHLTGRVLLSPEMQQIACDALESLRTMAGGEHG